MDVASINELAADRLVEAVSAESGRSSVTVYSRRVAVVAGSGRLKACGTSSCAATRRTMVIA
ncbi:hypothetical protein AB0I34_23940 [Kribbella sp. NPDC050281]|uniref:hypothetical protein n=1 Tax=Kribbella sp. NPDC050281 TaxID=3155515 RepID=UPI0033D3C783